MVRELRDITLISFGPVMWSLWGQPLPEPSFPMLIRDLRAKRRIWDNATSEEDERAQLSHLR